MRIFFGIASFQILAMFRRGLFYSYLSVYLRHYLGLSVTETTLFSTLPMILNILCQRYLWGDFSDRHQKRRSLIVCGEVLAALGTVCVWAIHRWMDQPVAAGYAIILGLCVIEIFWSMSNIGWSALISDLYQAVDRGRVMGKLESLGGIGRIAGIWAGGIFYDGFGKMFPGWGFYDGILFFVAAAAMLISVFPMLMVPEGGVGGPDQGETHESSADGVRFFYFFLAAMVFLNFGRNSIAIILSQYLMLESGFNLSSLSLSYVANIRSVAMVGTGLVTGMLVGRFGNKKILMTGSVIAVSSLVMLWAATSINVIGLSSFFFGVSEVMILSSSYTIASRLIPPRERGKLFSWFNAAFFLSWGLAGTFIAGPVTDVMIALGSSQGQAYQLSFLTAAGLTGIGTLLLGAFFYYAGKGLLESDVF